jgi:protein-tyrosine phosphatase
VTFIARFKKVLGRGDAAEGASAHAAAAVELRILMVCMGNICRSPIAEGVLRAKLAAAGLQRRVWVDSAGTHGYHTNEAPDPRAIRRAAYRGYAIGGLRARPVATADFDDFDWILAMDDSNLAWLKRHQPVGSAALLAKLLDHASQHRDVTEVPDPYYGAEAGFDHVLDLVEDACDGVMARVQSDAGLKA